MTDTDHLTIAARYEDIVRRIEAACARSGRNPADVHLVAVSKTHPAAAVCEAARAGIAVFGENKVQEAAAKIPECPGQVSWHLVGHLQRNKAAAAVELFDAIHSVDSLRLLEALESACEESGRRPRILIEVNVSGEASKFGLRPGDVPAVLRAAQASTRLELRGLMTMPPMIDDLEKVRPYFRRLRELRDRWQDELGVALPELSMGMSHDFEVAIEEGAHWIRVGTALFGSRPQREAPVENGI